MRLAVAGPVALGVLGVLGALGAPAARAESEQAISVGLGWATFSTVGEAMANMEPPALAPTIGGSLALSYERMIGTDFALRAELVGGLFYGGTQEGKMQSQTSNALLVDAGAALRFDVLKYVPYAFVGLGAVTSGGGPIERGTDLVLVVGGGLDWLQSRSRSYGLEARLASFGGDVTVVTAGIRGTVRWGYF
ncbi:MAG TPA: hypothetical protein VNO30_07830 [Kofleriaceae bacterium]|nr:hypothetical protein [Kofleriaceae bacterium]